MANNNNINVGFLLHNSSFFINTSNDTGTSNQFYIVNSNIVIGNSNYPTSTTSSNSIVNLYGDVFINNVRIGSGGGGGFSNGQSITTGTITTQNNDINVGTGTITLTGAGAISMATGSITTSGTISSGQINTQNNNINTGSGTVTQSFINSLTGVISTLNNSINTGSGTITLGAISSGTINTQNAAINVGTGTITLTGAGAISMATGSITTSGTISSGQINTQNNNINAGSGTFIAGTVGIGTTSPQSNLDVWGTMGVTIGGQKQFTVTSNVIGMLSDTMTIPFIVSTTLTTSVIVASNIIMNSSILTQNNSINAGSGTMTVGSITTQNYTINTGTGGITSGTLSCGNITSSGTLSITNPIPWRNRIYNGAMIIAQRGSATSNTLAGQYTTVDRWCGASNTSGLTLTQCNISPSVNTGFINALQVSTTTTTVSTPLIEQRIESSNILDIFAGNQVTVSFYAYQTSGTNMQLVVGMYAPNAFNNFTNQTSIGSATFGNISSSALTQYSGQITLGTGGTLTSTFNGGLALRFTTGATASAATFLITGVQLEKGGLVTPFEIRPYSIELGLCQRYFTRKVVTLAGWINGSAVNFAYTFSQTMRLVPTTPIIYSYGSVSDSSGGAVGGSGAIFISSNLDSVRISYISSYNNGGTSRAALAESFDIGISAEL